MSSYELTCHVLDTGYCLASEHHMLRGGERRPVECHALVALLGHPVHGWMLWDTGYAPRFLDATADWPYRLYRYATPLAIDSIQPVVDQLPRLGIRPSDIKRIIISHYHADHIASLRDFPAAELISSKEAYEGIRGRRGWSALARAYLPDLMPSDFVERGLVIGRFEDAPLPGLGPTHDIFRDGTIRLMRLPGHARGQMGLLAETTDGPKLFCADGAYMTRSIREQRPPHPITAVYTDDWRAVHTTLAALATFAEARPDVALAPTHCPEALAREVVRGA